MKYHRNIMLFFLLPAAFFYASFDAFASGYSDDYFYRVFDFKSVFEREHRKSCIGNPVTPECAYRTFGACYDQMQPSLCEKVGIKGLSFRLSPITDELSPIKDEQELQKNRKSRFYKIMYAIDIVHSETKLVDWLPENAVYLEVNSSRCDEEGKCLIIDGQLVATKLHSFMSYYVLYPQDGLWFIHRWNTENDGLTCYDYPDDPICKYHLSPDDDRILSKIVADHK